MQFLLIYIYIYIYIDVCSSPQIIRTHYDAFGDYFEIWTDDRYYWKFQVKKGN